LAALERNGSDFPQRAPCQPTDDSRPRKDTERSACVRALRPLQPVRPEFVNGGRPGILALDCWRACGGRGVKNSLTLGRELRPVADHAGSDAVDVRDFISAKAKRVAGAVLSLFCGVGVSSLRRQ